MTDGTSADIPAVTPERVHAPATESYVVRRAGYGHEVGERLSASDVLAAQSNGTLSKFTVRVKG